MDKHEQQDVIITPAPSAQSEAAEGLAAHHAVEKMDNQESEAAKQKRAEYKYRRGYAPRAHDNRTDWAIAERDSWLEDKHWTDTVGGKTAIEFVSRITLGGMFYALMGQSQAMKRMANYDPDSHIYDKTNAKPLEKIAYFLDKTLGSGIERLAKMRYGDATTEVNGKQYNKARMFVRFRNTRLPQNNDLLPGRSLGAEMTVVTADFAAMSIGTGIARELLMNTLNPRERKSWLKDGQFDPLHVGKKLLAKAWQLVSYNAGEDAAVALPYVFFLRGCRNTLDKFFPGFKYGSDSGVDSGGSVVVDDKGNITSELQVAGALDLQARFVTYNVFTQIYRDAYNRIGDSFNRVMKEGLKTPEWVKDPASIPSRVWDATKGTTRYLAISSIRSVLQMMPSVPFFSIFRTPASKPNGFAVHPEYGAVEGLATIKKPDGTEKDEWVKLRRDARFNYKGGDITETRWANSKLAAQHKQEIAYGIRTGSNPAEAPKNPFTVRNNDKEKYNEFASSRPGNPLYYNPLSRITDKLGNFVHETARMPIWHKAQKWFWDLTGYKDEKSSKEMSYQAMLAGIPYASYFAAKVYFRERYVNEQMNLSIGRMLDGIMKWNRTDFVEGMNEIQRTMLGLPFRQTSRKAELIMTHRHNPSDNSPMPERWTRENHKEYLAQVKRGDEPDPYELMEQLSNQRAEFYRERSRVYHEAQQKKSPKEEILQKEKAENWEQDTKERKARVEELTAVGV